MSAPASPQKGKRRFKWMIRFGAALLVYTIVGFVVVPVVIKSQMLKRLPELTKRQVAIEKVKFNPYALSLTIDAFSLKETNGEIFSSFEEFYGNFQPFDSLLHLTWVFDSVHLQKPFFQITYRADGTFNFANLISTNAVAPKAASAPSSPLPSLVVHSLSISNGAVAFADLTRPVPFRTEIIPIDFSFTNLATIRDRNSPYIFMARTTAGETFAWSGSITVNPLSSDGSIRLGSLPLSRYTTYSHEYGRLDFSNGVVTVMADYHFASGTNGLALAVSNASVEIAQLELKLADNGTRLGLSNILVNYTFDAHGPNGQPLQISLTNASFALSGLDLKAPETGETVLAIPSLVVTNVSANLVGRTANIGLVKSTGGSLSVRQEHDGKINLLSLVPATAGSSGASPANPPVPTTNASPFVVKIGEIAFDDYAVKVEDKKPSQPAELNLDQINLNVKNVSNQTNTPVALGLSTRFQKTGTFAVTGNAFLMPLTADLQIILKNIDLRAIQPYVEERLKLAITSGMLNADGYFYYGMRDPLIIFTGNAGITNFNTADDVLFKDFLKWDNLAVNGIDVQFQPDKFKVDEVKFTGLNTSIIIGPDHRANVQTILRDQVAAATNNTTANASTNPTVPDAKKPVVALGTLAFDNASFHFADQSIEPHSAFDIQQFGGEIKGLSSDEDSTATVDVRGNVDARSPFSVSGKVNPLSKDLFVDVTLAFTNTDLTAFTPYTEKFVGRPLQKGKFSFGVHYDIEKKNLKAENGFYVDQLTFGPKNESTNATSLPVKLAVALLKDRKGRIQLGVPVTGRTDDPKFKLGPIIWQVINNLIVKAATSPFSLLGSLVGGGPELSFVNFDPAQSIIPETETNKLNKLAKALYERPELTVELNGSVNPALDHDALARLKLDQQLKSRYIRELGDAGKPVVALDQVRWDPTNRARVLALLFKETIGEYTAAATNATSVALIVTNQPPVKYGKSKPELFPVLMYTYDSKLKPVKETTVVPVATVATVVATVPPSAAADMESQLLAKIALTQDDWRDLMKQRAAAVQDYLIKTGQVTGDRLFITAPKPMNSLSTGEDKVNLTLD